MKQTPEQPNDLASRLEDSPAGLDANLPLPASERGAWATAIALGLLGAGVLALVLSGVIGSLTAHTSVRTPPAVIAVTPTPTPAPAGSKPVSVLTPARPHAIVGWAGGTGSTRARPDVALYETSTNTHISEAWMQGFYPIYAAAQRTFGVNWLLIASIHKQESAFSTAPSTYHGLNFAGCCGGPMQFNVKNGGPLGESDSTWALVSDSYRYGQRPVSYDHMTATHPSIYDDFDSIMAAAHLLSADGAEMELNGAAWNAAYDYYGHDLTGVSYADQVLARAIGWSQHGFCINCGLEEAMLQAVYAAYGAPVAATYETATVARAKPRKHRHRKR